MDPATSRAELLFRALLSDKSAERAKLHPGLPYVHSPERERGLETRIDSIKKKIYDSPDTSVDDLNAVIGVLHRSGRQNYPAPVTYRSLRPEDDRSREIQVYESLLEDRDKRPLEEYGIWTSQLRHSRGDEFVDRLFEWIDRPQRREANFEKLGEDEFRDMLKRANWNRSDIPSSIVNGRLWFGSVKSKPQYHFGYYEGFRLAIRLNGHALRPQQADQATCELHGITTVLPPLFVGVRYRSVTDPQTLDTQNLIILGNVFRQSYRNRLQASIPSLQGDWHDTGFLLVAGVSDLGFRCRQLYLIYNSSNEDVAVEYRSEEESKERAPFFCEGPISFTIASVGVKGGGAVDILRCDEEIRGGRTRDMENDELRLTVLSEFRLEFVELGVKGDSSAIFSPIPLVPRSTS